jgi:hypothetical protein
MRNSQLCMLISILWLMVGEITRREDLRIYCFVWFIFGLIIFYIESKTLDLVSNIKINKLKYDYGKHENSMKRMDTIIQLLKKEKIKKHGR